MNWKKAMNRVLVIMAALLLALLSYGLSSRVWARQPVKPCLGKESAQVLKTLRTPICFEASQDKRSPVEFFCRGPGYELHLTPTAAIFVYPDKTPARPRASQQHPYPEKISARVVSLQWLGANPAPRMVAQDKMKGYRNYYVGNRPEKWRTKVPLYRRVFYQGVYPGIDLVFYERNGRLEYDFVVAPGADPKAIRLAFQGVDRLSLDKKGHLILQAGESRIVQRVPLVYQEIGGVKNKVAGRYLVTAENQVSFTLYSYDPTRTLVIDPTLDFSTYLGGGEPLEDTPAFLLAEAEDDAHAVALDMDGNVYVTGVSGSDYCHLSSGDSSCGGFPRTSWPGGTSIWIYPWLFITKFSPTGEFLSSALIFGEPITTGFGIAIDNSGNVYVTGETRVSDDFPTLNEYQADPDGILFDAFLIKLNSQLNTLLYATYLGGTGHDKGTAIAVDNLGHAYVTGRTRSPDFPIKNAFMTDPDGDREDAFVAKFNTNLAGEDSLVYSTYLDGHGDGRGMGIATDSSGNVYVTGKTSASDFPLQNAYRGYPGGCYNVFVAKLNSAGDSLLYSTYLGASSSHWTDLYGGVGGIAVDNFGNAYVTGTAKCSSFPTRNAYRSTLLGLSDAFITRLDTTLSGDASLIYSTFLGGSFVEDGLGIAANSAGRVFVTGMTQSPDFPLREFLPPATSGAHDIFLTALDTNLAGDASLIWSTYLGGSFEDQGFGVAMNDSGCVAVTGVTLSPDLPVTPGAFQTAHANVESYDAFVMKWSDSFRTALPIPDGPHTFFYPLPSYTLLRPYPSGCQPLGSAQMTKGTLNMQVGLPKFEASVDLYLALFAGDDANSDNAGETENLPLGNLMYFINSKGELQSDGQTMVPWKLNVTEPVDQLLAVDISGMEMDAEHCYLALIAMVPSNFQVDQAVSETTLSNYYAWLTRIPVLQNQYEKILLSLQSLLDNGKKDRALAKAVNHLQTSLNPEFWLDAWTPSDLGLKVFGAHGHAVHELMKSKTQPQEVSEAINTLLTADATLATNAIVDAVAKGGEPHKIKQARKDMAKAGQELAAENFDDAINFYGNAWNQAEQALQMTEAQQVSMND